MKAPAQVSEPAPLGDLEDFREVCEQHAFFLDLGILALPVAADNLQYLAERWDLIELHGQDKIQRLMAQALSGIADPPIAPATLPEPEPPKRAYRTPQATVDAFFYVLQLDDPEYLARWIAKHPLDASHLQKIWEQKCSRPTR